MIPVSGFEKYKQYLSLGAEIAVALSAPILLGYWLDQKYDSSPAILLGGIAVGMLLLVLIFIKIVRNTREEK